MTRTGNFTPVPPGPPPVTRGDAQPMGELARALTYRQTTMIGLGAALGTGLADA